MEEAPDPEALAVGAEIVRGTSAFPVSKGILEASWLRRVMSRLNAKLRQPPWPEILRHPTLRPGTLDDLVVKSAG